MTYAANGARLCPVAQPGLSQSAAQGSWRLRQDRPGGRAHHAFELGDARPAIGTAFQRALQCGESLQFGARSGCEVLADGGLRDTEATADDLACRDTDRRR